MKGACSWSQISVSCGSRVKQQVEYSMTLCTSSDTKCLFMSDMIV